MISSEEEGEIKHHEIPNSRQSSWNYKILKKIGEGTFGEVFLSSHFKRKYALKSIKYSNSSNGFPITALREIKILKSLKHESIINIVEIAVKRFDSSGFNRNKCEIFFVLPYIKTDLNMLIRKQVLSREEIRLIFRQIVAGMIYLKSEKILHRDLKTSNILIDDDYNVKIADFGLSKTHSQNCRNTPGVVTLWYRAPEILLGYPFYDYAVDVWSLGCILSEMFLRKPVFKGNNDITQLEAIIYGCGTINEKSFTNLDSLEYYSKYKLPQSVRNLKVILKNCEKDFFEIVDNIFVIDPSIRSTVNSLIDHKYLKKRGLSGGFYRK